MAMRGSGSSFAWPYWLPIRGDLRGSTPYGAPQISGVTALNTNENPFELPEEVVEAIVEKIREIAPNLNRYPDRDALELRTKLAAYIKMTTGVEVTSENIWAANGSNEILQTIFLACGGERNSVLGFTPSYSVHNLIAQLTRTPWIAGSRDGNFAIDVNSAIELIKEKNPKIVIVTTPNNPSGTSTTIEDLMVLAQSTKRIDALLVVDEAYAEFSSEKSAISLIEEFPHVVVVRTMSKAFAYAGVRIGYLVANPAMVSAALIARLPYHLSAITQAVGEVALDHYLLMQREIDLITNERNRVSAIISQLGLSPMASEANFILFKGFTCDSQTAWEFFLKHDLLVRDNGLRGYLRVTIGTPEENDKFVAALREFAASYSPQGSKELQETSTSNSRSESNE